MFLALLFRLLLVAVPLLALNSLVTCDGHPTPMFNCQPWFTTGINLAAATCIATMVFLRFGK